MDVRSEGGPKDHVLATLVGPSARRIPKWRDWFKIQPYDEISGFCCYRSDSVEAEAEWTNAGLKVGLTVAFLERHEIQVLIHWLQCRNSELHHLDGQVQVSCWMDWIGLYILTKASRVGPTQPVGTLARWTYSQRWRGDGLGLKFYWGFVFGTVYPIFCFPTRK